MGGQRASSTTWAKSRTSPCLPAPEAVGQISKI